MCGRSGMQGSAAWRRQAGGRVASVARQHATLACGFVMLPPKPKPSWLSGPQCACTHSYPRSSEATILSSADGGGTSRSAVQWLRSHGSSGGNGIAGLNSQWLPLQRRCPGAARKAQRVPGLRHGQQRCLPAVIVARQDTAAQDIGGQGIDADGVCAAAGRGAALAARLVFLRETIPQLLGEKPRIAGGARCSTGAARHCASRTWIVGWHLRDSGLAMQPQTAEKSTAF